MARYVDHYQGERRQTCTTPKSFFEDLHRRYAFTLDGAALPGNALLPRFSSEAIPRRWEGERVFCNPPWSSIPPFVELASLADLAVLDQRALVPPRT